MNKSESSAPEVLDFSLDNLPLDVFELADPGLTLDSLTAGHGMPENAASAYTNFCLCSCSQCSS